MAIIKLAYPPSDLKRTKKPMVIIGHASTTFWTDSMGGLFKQRMWDNIPISNPAKFEWFKLTGPEKALGR